MTTPCVRCAMAVPRSGEFVCDKWLCATAYCDGCAHIVGFRLDEVYDEEIDYCILVCPQCAAKMAAENQRRKERADAAPPPLGNARVAAHAHQFCDGGTAAIQERHRNEWNGIRVNQLESSVRAS